MSLLEAFKQLANWSGLFVAPGGNQGDYLIYLGAYKLADAAGIKFSSIICKKMDPVESVPIVNSGAFIYLQGGGSFTPWWGWTGKLLRRLRRANPGRLIIVGPTTVDPEYADFVTLDDRIIFYAREKTTLNLLRGRGNIQLDHDTALNLRMGDGYLEKLVSWQPLTNEYTLLARRGDNEKSELPESIKPEAFDIDTDPCLADDWGRLHARASRIVTDRCHSAILGSILNKDTSIFSGRYHKNRSMWEYSLRDRGVKWVE